MAHPIARPHPRPLSRSWERGAYVWAQWCVRLPLSQHWERGSGGEGRESRTLPDVLVSCAPAPALVEHRAEAGRGQQRQQGEQPERHGNAVIIRVIADGAR